VFPEITDTSSVMRAAAQEERRLWEAVKGRHPGQLKHDAGAWSAWVCAERKLRRLTDEAKAADLGGRAPTKTAWGCR
jgi:hypothetical protein